jgi:bifunctional DNA-binding transcriptional regulator/antitoxin component of YhaV-PrlF toxin-antitoxin module
MSTKNVTVTSKNQVTLPSEYVKVLNLAQSRVLQAEVQEGKIILTPQPALSIAMKKFWSKHNANRALTNEEIKQATRTIAAERFTEAK